MHELGSRATDVTRTSWTPAGGIDPIAAAKLRTAVRELTEEERSRLRRAEADTAPFFGRRYRAAEEPPRYDRLTSLLLTAVDVLVEKVNADSSPKPDGGEVQ